MEIVQRRSADALEVAVAGRIDAHWSGHLARVLEEAVRAGADRLRLDLAAVRYMSSAGIRVLLTFHQQLTRIGGSFAVANPSEAVREVLEMAGLLQILLEGGARVAGAPEALRAVERTGASFEVYELAATGDLECVAFGDPERVERCAFEARDCRSVAFPDGTFGLGLGALGSDFEDCRARFGEFVAAGGAAAYLPGDGTNSPDFLFSRTPAGARAGRLLASEGPAGPEVHLLYGLRCAGAFRSLLRFEARTERGALGLAEVASACLALQGTPLAGIAMVCESRGLVGASLRRSPALGAAVESRFAYPEVKEWLSFTAEPAFPHGQALVVGIAAEAAPGELAPFLRPLAEGAPLGHFHGAAFSYRPLPRGRIELGATVASLFENAILQGVLHLLHDARERGGGIQSEFARGVCWVAPIGRVAARPGRA